MEKTEELDLEHLKRNFNLDDAAITACGFREEELQKIFNDYLHRRQILEQYKKEFISDYIVSAQGIRFHSYSGRVKDAYHLIEKIIRKRNNKDSKYASMGINDYYKYITDLISCRILLVYKKDWRAVHSHFIKVFPNDPQNYIDGYHYREGYDKVALEEHAPFMAEKPVVYIRQGDDESLYQGVEGIRIDRGGYYRSVHYIIRYREYYVELQVRSIFEEAWSEVDHDVLYPLYKDNIDLVRFSTLLNRAAGMGDEISAYFKDYVKNNATVVKNQLRDTPILTASASPYHAVPVKKAVHRVELEKTTCSTPKNELQKLLDT